MRIKIQDYLVQVENLEVHWVYGGVIEGGWVWAAKNKLKYLKNKCAYDVLNEPDWDNIPLSETVAGPLRGYFYNIPDEYKGKFYPHPSGFWAVVRMRSHSRIQEKDLDFSEYNCIVFLENFSTEILTRELEKIDWAKVCKDGDITT